MATKKAKGTAKTSAKSTNAGNKPRTKSEIVGQIAEEVGLSRKDVNTVLSALTSIVHKDIGKKGPGVFTLPGLCKFQVRQKPATKARKGVNPFTGQEMTFKAKPARNVVKIRPLKALKENV